MPLTFLNLYVGKTSFPNDFFIWRNIICQKVCFLFSEKLITDHQTLLVRFGKIISPEFPGIQWLVAVKLATRA